MKAKRLSLFFLFSFIFFGGILFGQSINILSPNGGEYWTVGEKPRITWNSSGVTILAIDLSYDDGTTWENIAPVVIASSGYSSDWVIPDITSDQCRIRISQYGNPDVYDISDNTFKIAYSDSSQDNIVVLGSSTAAGVGPSSSDSAWVTMYRNFLFEKNTNVRVINLAVGGYTTYEIMPDEFVAPADRPSPAIGHNITKAISYNPRAIIINLPSNDVNKGYSIQEQLANYDTVVSRAALLNIPVWIATTQPRNFSDAQKLLQMEMRDSTVAIYGEYAIDFWTGLAEENGDIIPDYNSGDGVHLNNAGHKILVTRVIDKNIYEQTILPTSIEEITESIPSGFVLMQNYPNPFNPATVIRYSIPVAALSAVLAGRQEVEAHHVTLIVYDILGNEVTTLVNENQPAGNYQVKFNASGLASGMYIYKLSAGNFIAIKKMVMLK